MALIDFTQPVVPGRMVFVAGSRCCRDFDFGSVFGSLEYLSHQITGYESHHLL
jgi:hypothetical protein